MRAATLEPDPAILDTLAEAYFVNGQAEEALKIIQQAMLKNPRNQEYFLSQKQKFEASLSTAPRQKGAVQE